MLTRSSYSQLYIDSCRLRVEAQVNAYRACLTGAPVAAGGPEAPPAPVSDFEGIFFGNMLLALDYSFLHRSATIAGRNGNPINEVRMLATSLSQFDGSFTADRTIRLTPASSVLGYSEGDRVSLNEHDFVSLAAAFFTEIERRYSH